MEFERALALHRQGRAEEAAGAYEQLLLAEPAHLDALVHLGVLRLGQGRAGEAEALLRRAATAAPHSAEAVGNLAAALQAQARHEEAAAHYERALALKPDMADARFGMAACLQACGRNEEAIACYRFLLATDPAHPEANYGLATLLAQHGRADEAAEKFRAALAADPDFAEASFGLGKLLARGDAVEEAIGYFLHALDVDPDYIEARFALGTALAQLRRDDEAIVAFRAVLAAMPEHAWANYGLAVLLAQHGHADEAAAKFRAALAAHPNFALASYGLGRLLAGGDTVEQARDCFLRALEIDPDYTDARVALAATLSKLHRDDEAMAEFRTALLAEPDHPEAHNGIGVLLYRKQLPIEAIRHYRSALARKPKHVDAMVGLANALKSISEHDEALEMARRAVALRPDHAWAASVLGGILGETGSIDEADVQLRRALALAPDQPEFSYAVVQLKKIAPGDDALRALEDLLPRAATLSVQDQSILHFALAMAYDDIGERDRGFAHLLLGNAAKRSLIDYDAAATASAMDRIAQVFTADMLSARRDLGDPSRLPVFIVGMPRSGTTLVEQTLASHHAVFGAGERMDVSLGANGLRTERPGAPGFPDAVVTMSGEAFRRMGSDYVAALRPLAPNAARITDKLPGNFVFLGLIRLMLPNARIIHLVRDPVDTCLSCFSKLFTEGVTFSYDLAELGGHHRAYQRLMAHWRSVLPPDVFMEVRYEELVHDFEPQVRRLVAFCGLDWDPACLEFHKTSRPVRTASMTQVRQSIYRSSVGRWRPDAALLRPLLEALGEIIAD
jgi:tetratricopeptide (TPR) repeat protein